MLTEEGRLYSAKGRIRGKAGGNGWDGWDGRGTRHAPQRLHRRAQRGRRASPARLSRLLAPGGDDDSTMPCHRHSISHGHSPSSCNSRLATLCTTSTIPHQVPLSHLQHNHECLAQAQPLKSALPSRVASASRSSPRDPNPRHDLMGFTSPSHSIAAIVESCRRGRSPDGGETEIGKGVDGLLGAVVPCLPIIAALIRDRYCNVCSCGVKGESGTQARAQIEVVETDERNRLRSHSARNRHIVSLSTSSDPDP